MTDDLVPRVKLGQVQPVIHRDCWMTMWHNAELNVDLMIGAGTKEACIRAFELLSIAKCNEDLVYAATVVATKDGIQPFRGLLPESILCTCIIGHTRSTEFCNLHGGRRRG